MQSLNEWRDKCSEFLTATVTQNKYIPQRPEPKQALFLSVTGIEALYGGSAGGGKSSALLMAALQFVHVPNYSALLLRKTFADLNQPGALIPRSFAWLGETDAAWKASEHAWYFPNGAALKFGYLAGPMDKYQYQSSEFQFCGFDELTQFQESDYRYMFSRLRKGNDMNVPLRMRAASNPGGRGHCLPYGDVLTPDKGWVPIERMRVGDQVFTVRPDGVMVRSRVGQVHAEMYKGNLVVVEQRGFQMACTPNHSVAQVLDRRKNKFITGSAFKLSAASDLPGSAKIKRAIAWCGKTVSSFKVPDLRTRKSRITQPDELTGDSYCEFMGWFLSEGSAMFKKNGKRFDIAQSKEHGRTLIAKMLMRCGFHFKTSATGFHVHSPKWAHWLMTFGKSREKFVPQDIKGAPTEQLRLFFHALINGDGHWASKEGGSGHFYTLSDRLADDVQEIALKLGYVVSMNKRQRENRLGKSITVNFKVSKGGCSEILTGNHVYDVGTSVKRTPDLRLDWFEGSVFCIGIPETHTFIVRQRGSVWVSGNSWVKQRFLMEGRQEGRWFIPASLADNPHLNQEAYVRSLMHLDPITRAQLLRGDWSVRQGGSIFRREWFGVPLASVPMHTRTQWCRFWDLAATPEEEGVDPDYTAGALVALIDGVWYLKDMRRFRGSPKENEDIIRQTASLDPSGTKFRMEQEGGASGKSTIDHYARHVLAGYDFKGVPSQKNKLTRAGPFSTAVEVGNFKLIAGNWISDMLDECEAFTGDGKEHDDQVDAISGAMKELAHGESHASVVTPKDHKSRIIYDRNRKMLF